MKELTIEQKAKRYDEAIERAKYYYNKGKTIEFANYVASNIFPELKESADELIRKGIIRNLEYLANRAEGFVKDEIKERIAYLEKQGADKPYYTELRGYFENGKRLNHSVEEIINWLESKI